MNVSYTNEEAQAAIQLYDMAVKANGLAVSEAALFLTKKLQEASKESSIEVITNGQKDGVTAEVVNV